MHPTADEPRSTNGLVKKRRSDSKSETDTHGEIQNGQSSTSSSIEPFDLVRDLGPVESLRANAAALCAVEPSQIEDMYPCTPFQEGVIADGMHRPGAYVSQYSLSLPPALDVDRFINAWERVFDSNAILRTRIVSIEPRLVQVVLKENFSVHFDGDSHGSGSQQSPNDVCVLGLGQRMNAFTLVRHDETRSHHFIWTVQHALYDGVSLCGIFDDVAKVYCGLNLEERPGFDTFIRYLKDANEANIVAYWQSQFAGLENEQFPHVPSGVQRSVADTIATTRCPVAVQGMSDAKVACYVRAAWSVVISKWTGCEDVVFGAVVAGRTQAVHGVRRINAPTVALVPVRIVLDMKERVSSLVARIQQQAREMKAYEQVGLKSIAQSSPETRQACEFQSVLVVQPKDYTSIRTEHLGTWEKLTDATKFTSHAICVQAFIRMGRVEIMAAFDSECLKVWEVENMLEQLGFVMKELLATPPDQKLGELHTVPTQDLGDIWTWNAEVPETVGACVHDLIAETVRRQPDAPAVCAWDGELTYGELDELSTRLAHHLMSVGVGPEVVVPLCFEKSMWTPVAMLGVMKAGGASVALDVTQPEARLRTIVQQVRSRHILSSMDSLRLAESLADGAMVVAVDEDRLNALPLVRPTDSPGHFQPVQAANSLYVVFTSGSTGTPKGIVITHRNFSSALVHQRERLGFGPGSRILDFASYAFDAAWYNVLHALHAGSCLCVPSENDRRSDLSGCVARLKPNFANLTPKVAELLDLTSLQALDMIELTGEPADTRHVARMRESSMIRFAYGPAECSVMSTVSAHDAPCPSIGRGIGVRTWVVESSNPTALACLGCIGELWIEGPLVGRGYLDDPAKTAAAFLEDPPWLLRGGPGHLGRRRRLYRTGDLVRYRADGSLDFVGRMDGQVKIRGQRVELGEVEHHVRPLLGEHDEGEGAQVVAEVVTPQGSDKPTLAAFVVPAGGESITAEELRGEVARLTADLDDHLGASVPAYMIPSVCVPLASVPTTTTGKLDRRRLREMGAATELKHVAERDDVVAPINETESTLQAIWSSVLNVPAPSLSVEATFVSLGGDSITAMQVVTRCRQQHLRITVIDLLQLQTIRKISPQCRQILPATETGQTPESTIDDEGSVWLLSPVQQMFFDAHPDGLNHFNQASLLKLKRQVPAAAVLAASLAIVQRHSMLRARFRRTASGVWEQYVDPASPDAFLFAEHGVGGRSELKVAAQGRQESLNIGHGPVFAVDVFHMADGAQALLLSAHHLVIDLVSWRFIWHDLQECLEGRTIGPKPTSFRTWSELQREKSQSLVPAQVLPYAIEPAHFDFWGITAEQNRVEYGESFTTWLEPETTALLLGESNHAFQSEPLDFLVAAMLYAFHTIFADRPTPAAFVEGHGREAIGGVDLDVSETVGWFTTLSPIQIPADTKYDAVSLVKVVTDLRRRVPEKGRPYFACRYHSDAGRRDFNNHDQVELLLNYAGVYQQLESEAALFTRLDERQEAGVELKYASPQMHRVALVEINAAIENGWMALRFTVSKRMKHQPLLRRWAELVAHTLKETVQ